MLIELGFYHLCESIMCFLVQLHNRFLVKAFHADRVPGSVSQHQHVCLTQKRKGVIQSHSALIYGPLWTKSSWPQQAWPGSTKLCQCWPSKQTKLLDVKITGRLQYVEILLDTYPQCLTSVQIIFLFQFYFSQFCPLNLLQAYQKKKGKKNCEKLFVISHSRWPFLL